MILCNIYIDSLLYFRRAKRTEICIEFASAVHLKVPNEMLHSILIFIVYFFSDDRICMPH